MNTTAQETECNARELRRSLLDRQIDAVKDAIGRARATWLFATLFTFVVATALFNGTDSWNFTQIERRAEILRDVTRESSVVRTDLTNPDSELSKHLVEELAYLRKLRPNDSKERFIALQKAADEELRGHVARRIAFDTVQIPLIGLSVTASDVGIVGGLGLTLVGYWLLVAVRAESHAFGEFIECDPSTSSFLPGRVKYTLKESEYAFSAIRHYMTFGVSTPGSGVNIVTSLCFLVPAALMLLNHASTIGMLEGRLILGSYNQPHVLLELGVALLVIWAWGRALMYQTQTVSALQAWRYGLERGHISEVAHFQAGWVCRSLNRAFARGINIRLRRSIFGKRPEKSPTRDDRN